MMLDFYAVLLIVLFLPAPHENLVIPNLKDSKINEEKNENGRRCLEDPAQKKKREEDCIGLLEDKNLSEKYISGIKDCIVDYYCFIKHDSDSEWIKQPPFKELLDKPHFKTAATLSQKFFEKNPKWKDTIDKWKKEDITSLLYITAARYVYVIYTLYQESPPKIKTGVYETGKERRIVPC